MRTKQERHIASIKDHVIIPPWINDQTMTWKWLSCFDLPEPLRSVTVLVIDTSSAKFFVLYSWNVVALDDYFLSLYERGQKKGHTVRLKHSQGGCPKEKKDETYKQQQRHDDGLCKSLSLFPWHVGSLAQHFIYFRHAYLAVYEVKATF